MALQLLSHQVSCSLQVQFRLLTTGEAVPEIESWGSAACTLVTGMRRLLLGGSDTAFSFLDLPREVRNKVYRSLLSVAHNPDGTFVWISGCQYWRKNFPGLGLLGVNRQIRAEAWHVLVNDNAWISVTFCGDFQLFNHLGSSDSPFLVSGPRFIARILSEEMRREIFSNAVMNLCLGPKSGSKGKDEPRFDQLLVFHPKIWPDLVNEIAQQVDERHGIHITCRRDVHLDTSTSGRAFEDIVKTMFVIRGASEATVSGCGDRLDALAASMATPIRNYADVLAIIGQFKDAGDDYVRQGNLRAAVQVYYQGYVASAVVLPEKAVEGRALEGSPLGNSVYAAVMGLLDSWSQALTSDCDHQIKIYGSKMPTSQLPLDSPPPGVMLVDSWRPQELLNTAVTGASAVLRWPGVTDKQRRLSHWHGASAFSVAAKLDEEALEKVKLTKSDCQMRAAKDYWYAMQIDGPDADLLQRLYTDMCRAINRDPEEPFDLRTVRVPALGDWTGDPTLIGMWGRNAMIMRLYQQRISPDMGETMDEEELRELYERDGIHWHHGPDGSLHFDGPGIPDWAFD
ncbi:hypothetical protein KJ359_013019 [Pestalotiopsis sp. 9143b]|nr:hypothetical protein KJ359_013019 [Pestalotiopsis sp. 9143b]